MGNHLFRLLEVNLFSFICCSAYAQVSDNASVDSLLQTLPEVMVRGERPVVKAEGAKLVYDLPRMLEGTGVSNAYDALKELPSVVEMQESLALGGQPVTVIIDEKVQTLTKEQLYGLLKAMPASRLAKAEVLYNAPARYQVRGTVINIVLKHSDLESLQGEAYGSYAQRHDAMWEERASLVWSKGKLTTDLLYDHLHGSICLGRRQIEGIALEIRIDKQG